MPRKTVRREILGCELMLFTPFHALVLEGVTANHFDDEGRKAVVILTELVGNFGNRALVVVF
jgi:hypothetical protein